MPDILIELFSEEIPARMQGKAAADLKRLVTDGLVEAGLTYASAGAFSTPRRLTLAIEGLTAESRASREERKGPRVDAPEAAVAGFLRSTGVPREALEARGEGKAAAWFAVVERPGRGFAAILAEVLERTVRDFPWPKSMRWGDGGLRWVRPLHSILCIASDEGGASVVPVTVDDLVAGDTTEGHRFLSPGRFAVTGFDDYAKKLRARHVMLDAGERAASIWNDATNLAFAQGMTVLQDDALLAEVAGLVEWPVVLMGEISEAFMELPPEVLQTSMREHQKFFSVYNRKTRRIDQFITVANRTTADEGAMIVAGNQRVLSARLSDAMFFWENDLRVARARMGEWAEGLKSVTFHSKLGSQADRVERIAKLARMLAPFMFSDTYPTNGADPELAERAAQVAKLSLRSQIVGEFPELQARMGRIFATYANENLEVAAAADDHYLPQGPDDPVPFEAVSMSVALADRLDLLAGFWWINEKPTGSKDPYALRRAALGVIRTTYENALRFRLTRALSVSLIGHMARAAGLSAFDASRLNELFKLNDVDVSDDYTFQNGIIRRAAEAQIPMGGEILVALFGKLEELMFFVNERIKVHLKEAGIRHDVVDACIAMPLSDDLTLLVRRAYALQGLFASEVGLNLLQGFKRANNILTQAETKDGVEYSFGADVKFAETDAERALFAALDAAEAVIAPAMAAEDFGAAMTAMAALRGPIDGFFDTVQVNADNPILRRNRLNLLHRIRATCGPVADLTRLEG